MKAKRIAFAAIASMMLFATPCFARVSSDYNSIAAEYGDKAASYTKQVPLMGSTVNEIHSKCIDAVVDTTTNIRVEPSHEVKSIVVIDIDEPVKILGFTDNDWARVYCITKDGASIFGYIRGDLLFEKQ